MPLKETLVAKPQLTWSVIGLLCLLVGYLVVLMYAQGGVPVRHHDADFKLGWLYIFFPIARLTPGAMFIRVSAGMGLFVLFPLICTIAIAFTNYSTSNQLTFERAQQVLMDRSFQAQSL